jgi:ABC-type lipoprotein export system ATPase subunit
VILVSHDPKVTEHADVVWTLQDGCIRKAESRVAVAESVS